MFVHRILHVLLNYSYITVLYSICQCTVQIYVQKKEEGKKKNQCRCQSDQMGLDQLCKGETGCR